MTLSSGAGLKISVIGLRPGSRREGGIAKIFADMLATGGNTRRSELDLSIDRLEEKYPMLPLKFPMLVKLVYKTFGEL